MMINSGALPRPDATPEHEKRISQVSLTVNVAVDLSPLPFTCSTVLAACGVAVALGLAGVFVAWVCGWWAALDCPPMPPAALTTMMATITPVRTACPSPARYQRQKRRKSSLLKRDGFLPVGSVGGVPCVDVGGG